MVVGLHQSIPSFSREPRFLHHHSFGPINLRSCRRQVARGSIRRPQILSSAFGNCSDARVFMVSDLHTDYSENMSWIKSLPIKRNKKDVLLVAGDVAETYNNFVLTVNVEG